MTGALINVPRTARPGEIVEIKTLVSHPMETGFRVGTNGTLIPRDIIGEFQCLYNGEEVFRMRLSPAIAANPFVSFSTVATESGTLLFRWTGDKGFTLEQSASITVG
ncbi:MAG: thiosulfate oxidation carrier complex protein SoxZ [Rhodospirillales bacterium]|nr:MAG: thiosulfate oxidation carrier complex protein SoxZ [Rhodospirillales bacterium]